MDLSIITDHLLLTVLIVLITLMLLNPFHGHDKKEYSVKTDELLNLAESAIPPLNNYKFEYDMIRSHVVNKTSESAWSMRGIGWLKEEKGLMFAIDTKPSPQIIGEHSIFIRETSGFNCEVELYDIWVRVSGSSLFAGLAKPSKTGKCAWEFTFIVEKPGTYVVESKMIMYNGVVDHHEHKCQIEKKEDINMTNTFSLTGWKFYATEKSCCEACSRLGLTKCTQWQTPSIEQKPGEVCSFQKPHLRQLKKITYGHSRAEPVPKFLGCGWSFWLTDQYPCYKGINDNVFGSGYEIEFVDDSKTIPNTNFSRDFCQNSEEFAPFGRWVSYPSLSKCPAIDYDPQFKKFKINKFDGNNTKCWHRDIVDNVGKRCLEGGCRHWIQQAWHSALATTTFEGFWEPYRCKYRLFSDQELQKCFIDNKIKSIKTDGMSIMSFLNQYLVQRLKSIKYSLDDKGVDVFIDTLRSPHILWHQNLNEMTTYFNKMSVNKTNELRFWVGSGFISSEREMRVNIAKSKQFNAMADTVLHDKGWHKLDWFDSSAAFSYDTATQTDGLHIVGPPMKLLVTKFFHYLCL
tara:strand:- start:265 stop:1980 length:1716 start_codon:yes stop_codon:yes gene_type:complete